MTLHKYLYANADPVTYTDPTGNFSLGQTLSAINTISNLVTTAQATYNLLESVATGDGEVSAKDVGIAFLSAAGGAAAGKLLKLLSKACNRRSACNYARAFTEAETKVQLLLMRTSSRRVARGSRNRVVVVVGAADIKKGRGTAAFNGAPVRVSPRLASHARKFLGLGIGERHACGNTVGRCAEWRSANNLIRSGSRIKHIRWTLAYFVNRDGTGVKRGGIAPYCAICTGAFGLEN